MSTLDHNNNSGLSQNFRIRTTNIAWLDLVVLGVVLGIINLTTVGFKDWGWMGVNPSPWLLLPLFLGARYGFFWGLWSGLGIAAVLFVGRGIYAVGHDDKQAILSILTDNLFFFLALPGAGFLAGETHGLLAQKARLAEQKARSLVDSTERLSAELEVAEESRCQLQERLALHGAEQSNLDRQLRGLFEPTAGAIFPNLLRLLRDMAGVTDAAIYAVTGQRLNRIATVGDIGRLPESTLIDDTEIAKLAVERKSLTTCKDLWQEAPDQNSHFIAALPWLGQDGVAALLLIHRMHFLGATWRNFSRIQMVCRWVAQFVDLRVQAAAEAVKYAGNTGALVVSPKALQSTLNQALAVHREWKLPSTMAVFEFTEPVPAHVAKLLPQTVGTVMRPTDVGSFEAEQEKPVFKVLLPMEGVRDAEAMLERALTAITKVPQLTGKVVANLAMTDDAAPA